MSNKIAVTGLGIISAIGNGVEENLHGLKAQKSGIGLADFLPSVHAETYELGEVKLSDQELATRLNLNPDDEIPRTALLALSAAKEAYANADLQNIDTARIGIIGGTTVGGMSKTENYYLTPEKNLDFIQTHSCGYITEFLARELNIDGYVSTLNTACSSATNAILNAARLIRHGIVDVVVAGGFDSLSKFTLNGFKTLMILSKEKCKPFDANRVGLSLGEGAGFIVLESEEHALKRGKKPLSFLTGWANANDAFHQTASSPEGQGAFLSMQKALDVAGLKPEAIDYVNVHGTATENNDLTEGTALKRIFGENVPPFSSTKSYVGHTLGAAGGVEAVYSVMAIQHKLIYPNLQFEEVISELQIAPETQLIEDRKVSHVMSNSFGFGGNDSTLIFSEVQA